DVSVYVFLVHFFFFQAEDGIRDFHVTGVQTCALPILVPPVPNLGALATQKSNQVQTRERLRVDYIAQVQSLFNEFLANYADKARSEERRVGKECRSRRRPEQEEEDTQQKDS